MCGQQVAVCKDYSFINPHQACINTETNATLPLEVCMHSEAFKTTKNGVLHKLFLFLQTALKVRGGRGASRCQNVAILVMLFVCIG